MMTENLKEKLYLSHMARSAWCLCFPKLLNYKTENRCLSSYGTSVKFMPHCFFPLNLSTNVNMISVSSVIKNTIR